MSYEYAGEDQLPRRKSPPGIPPPWTAEEVDNLNDFQWAGHMHPFTCPDRGDGKHRTHDEQGERYPDRGMLVATPNGRICRDCDYTQTWAHPAMVRGHWREWLRPT